LYPHHINALTVTERFPLVSYCRKKIIKTYSFAKVFCMKKSQKKLILAAYSEASVMPSSFLKKKRKQHKAQKIFKWLFRKK